MSRALLILDGPVDRQKATTWINKAPVGTRVEFKRPQRTLDQNSKMWACLTDVSEQVRWHGLRLSPDDWKILFLDALKRETRMVPNLDSNGFVGLGRSSSDLSKDEMSDLIEIVIKFGAEHEVQFHDTASDQSPTETVTDAHDAAAEEDGAGMTPDAPSSTNSDSAGSPPPEQAELEGGEAPPPASSSSPTSPADRANLIECAAKMFGILDDERLKTPEERRGVLESTKDAWKAELKPEHHPKLKGFFEAVDAIIRGKQDRRKAVECFASVLDCKPDDLGGSV